MGQLSTDTNYHLQNYLIQTFLSSKIRISLTSFYHPVSGTKAGLNTRSVLIRPVPV